MQVILHNVTARVSGWADSEASWLDDLLSFRVRETYYRTKGRTDHERLLNRGAMSFPAGLLAYVYRAAAKDGIACQVVDLRTPPCPVDATGPGWLDRPYQQEAVTAAFRRTRGILWIPTGGGKTRVGISMVARTTTPWLFLVHRSDLLEQTATSYAALMGEPAGRVGDGHHEWDRRFVVATYQTIYRLLKDNPQEARDRLRRFKGVIADEVHIVAPQMTTGVLNALVNAYWRIGLSGTPLARGDRRSLVTVGCLGAVVYRVLPQVLIDAGVLAAPTITMDVCRQDGDFPTWRGAEGALVVRSRPRNKLIADIIRGADKPCLVFVQRIQQGRTIHDHLLAAGIPSEFVWGAQTTELRRRAIDRLERADTLALVCSAIFTEGVDIPCLRSVVVAGGGASVIAALQRLGRGARVTQDKSTFEVWDVMDLGHPWIERHAKARRRAYESSGFVVNVRDAGDAPVQHRGRSKRPSDELFPPMPR